MFGGSSLKLITWPGQARLGMLTFILGMALRWRNTHIVSHCSENSESFHCPGVAWLLFPFVLWPLHKLEFHISLIKIVYKADNYVHGAPVFAIVSLTTRLQSHTHTHTKAGGMGESMLLKLCNIISLLL